MKARTFELSQPSQGRNGQPVDSPSPHTQAAMEADAKAFAASDEPFEGGLTFNTQCSWFRWKTNREHGEAFVIIWQTAQKLFKRTSACGTAQTRDLKHEQTRRCQGTWQEVFGNDADEYFHAWSVARYIGYVAAAGKAVNQLPLYVNAALRDPMSNPSATTYESGGATDNVIQSGKQQRQPSTYWHLISICRQRTGTEGD